MENKITVLQKLRKEILPGISIFEFVLFIIATFVGGSLFIWQIIVSVNSGDTNTLIMISYTISLLNIPLGILAATWLSKRSKWAPFLLAFDAIMYGTTNFLAQNWALGIVNAFITPFIWFFAFFYLWPKQTKVDEKGEIETKKLNLLTGFFVVGFVLLASTGFGLFSLYVLPHSFSENGVPSWLENFTIWFDSFAASLMLVAVIMGALRFRETWYLYFAANFLKIILFSISIAYGKMDDLMLLVIATSYFANTIFGMLIWKDSKEVSLKK